MADGGQRRWRGSRPLWAASAVLVACAVGGGSWWGLGGSGGPSVPVTVADCSAALNAGGSGTGGTPTTSAPTVVGVGQYASIAVFSEAGRRWSWCFDGMGTGTSTLPETVLQGPLSVPLVLHDVGTHNHQLLALVHHNASTTKVGVEVAGGHGRVVARGGQFEVLAVPLAKSLHWHARGPRPPAVVGRVIGYGRRGLVTGTEPLTICPGSIDTTAGTC